MRGPDLIIFDYDGVVADSELLNNAAEGLLAAGDHHVAASCDQVARLIDRRD